MAKESDILEVLEHAGVKGMKWGRRKAKEGPSAGMQRGAATVQKYGSKKKAVVMTVGRTVAIGVVARVGTNLITRALPMSPQALRGAAFVETALQVTNTALGIRDTVNIARQPRAQG